MNLDADIALRLADLRRRIAACAATSGRQAADVQLVAVSKTFGPEHIRSAVAAGQVDFGENRVQEALQKMEQCADLAIRWHLIGTLQSNKAGKAASVFSAIHSVDSLKLLMLIDAASSSAIAAPELLVQVDLAGETTKHGAPPSVALDIVRAGARCRSARVVGLMTIPPYFDNPEDARPYFTQLREMRDTLIGEGIDPSMLRELSMGMSHDFEIAVQEGATIVRVGTAIFGDRSISVPENLQRT